MRLERRAGLVVWRGFSLGVLAGCGVCGVGVGLCWGVEGSGWWVPPKSVSLASVHEWWPEDCTDSVRCYFSGNSPFVYCDVDYTQM